MSSSAAPKAPPPPPPKPPPPKGKGPTQSNIEFGRSTGKTTRAERICVYGPGGIGKSTLASLAPSPVFLDLEDSTGNIANVQRVTLPDGIEGWTLELVRQALNNDKLWEGAQTIVIDSTSRLEEICLAYVLRTVAKNSKGEKAMSIEDYGYGKGFGHLYDAFMFVLSDIDTAWRKGRNIVMVTHECTNRVPNPEGEDFIRFEPRLSDPSSGKNSIRLRVREWCDHLLRIGYDVVTKNGKAQGSGSRTIYPVERPHFMAKSRSLKDSMEFMHEADASIWNILFENGAK